MDTETVKDTEVKDVDTTQSSPGDNDTESTEAEVDVTDNQPEPSKKKPELSPELARCCVNYYNRIWRS